VAQGQVKGHSSASASCSVASATNVAEIYAACASLDSKAHILLLGRAPLTADPALPDLGCQDYSLGIGANTGTYPTLEHQADVEHQIHVPQLACAGTEPRN
jgi:hypothetical protein